VILISIIRFLRMYDWLLSFVLPCSFYPLVYSALQELLSCLFFVIRVGLILYNFANYFSREKKTKIAFMDCDSIFFSVYRLYKLQCN